MEINASEIFSAISAIGVIGGLMGVGIALRKDRREDKILREKELAQHVETWTNMNRDIKDVKNDISDIKKTLGNGAYSGIKQDIQAIKLNCGIEMADLKKQVEVNTPRICKLEDKIAFIEKIH